MVIELPRTSTSRCVWSRKCRGTRRSQNRLILATARFGTATLELLASPQLGKREPSGQRGQPVADEACREDRGDRRRARCAHLGEPADERRLERAEAAGGRGRGGDRG